MPVVSREVSIDAPRAAVWATLADIGAVSEWNPVVAASASTTGSAVEARPIEPDESAEPAGLGSTRHCDLPGGMGAIDEVVTGWDELNSMEFDIHGAKMMEQMRARFDLFEAGDSTRVSMTSDFRMSFGPLGALMASTVGKRMLARTMDQALGGLKAHVEGRAATSRSAPPSGAADPARDARQQAGDGAVAPER